MIILEQTIGREREREALLRNVTQGRHTLLIGRSGIGKSHLMIDLQRRMSPDKFAFRYLQRPVPVTRVAVEVYQWLVLVAGVAAPRKVSVERSTLSDLLKFIEDILALPQLTNLERQLVLFVDDFDHISQPAQPLFELLLERVVLVAACRGRAKNYKFSRLFSKFSELGLKPLATGEARELAKLAVKRVPGVGIPDERTFAFLINQLANLSNGVPLAIVESADRLRGAEQIDLKYVREMFAHRSGNMYFDASPLILCGIVFLVVMRYISRGMFQFERYAIFGALSGCMLIIRWFMVWSSRPRPT